MKRALGTVLTAISITVLTGCAGGADKRSTGQLLDDTALHAKVKAALVNDPEISGTKVDVDVERGVVRLSGPAANQQAKTKAEELVWGVQGVRAVENNLELTPTNDRDTEVKVEAEVDDDVEVEGEIEKK
ncbi:MAG: BON domain-containing protein [Verrucomicrobiota bacterium]|nr:BON domain-containing protein [Verrucomicrobiota bacterium]